MTRAVASRFAALTSCAAIAWLAGCEATPSSERSSITLNGVDVPSAVLARGERVYRQRCLLCHGESGDGKGPMGVKLSPPPLDLRSGKYPHAPDPNALPDDAYFDQLLVRGIENTPMQPFDLEHDDRHAVIQYIKSLSPRFVTK